jgi:hypothetical protein
MTSASLGSFLRADEQLVRLHVFRYLSAQGCALGSIEIVVEEALGDIADASRCVARPRHARLVTRPEYTIRAPGVEAALRAVIERLRGRPLTDAFFPSA